MRRIILLLTLLLGFNLQAADRQFDFKHIKLGDLLKKRAHLIEHRDQYNDIQKMGLRTKSATPVPLEFESNSAALANKLNLNINSNSESIARTMNIQKSFVDLKSDSLIYKSILAFLGNRFQQIGSEEAGSIIDHSQDFDFGESNFSGFNWQKPMGTYGIHVDRKVTPDYKDPSRWIVLDTFEVSINADTLLKKLVDTSLISLNGIGAEAFAGIVFKRRYSYYHFANSYVAGLTSDFSKLFLPFLQFSKKKLLNMPQYNYLKKEDFLSVSAGATVETPPVYGFDLRGGVMVEVSRTAAVSAQALGPNDEPKEGEFLRVNIDKELKVKTGVSADLQVDFFKLLKLTLLSYELQYSFASQDSINLSIYKEDKKKLLDNSLPGKEFSKLLRLFNLKVKYLEGNVVSSEQRKKSDLSSEYSAFIFGKLKKSKTESVKIIKDNKVKTFFRHTAENVSVEKSLLSRIWNSLIYKLFEINTNVKNVAYKSKRFVMEYDSDRRQNTDVFKTEDFSIELSQKLEVKKTSGWTRKRFRKTVAKAVVQQTSLDHEIAKNILKEKLIGPVLLDQKVMIQKAAMDAFHKVPEDLAFLNFTKVCKSKRAHKWMGASSRRKYMKRLQVGRELCVKKLGKYYYKYINDVKEFGRMDLDYLKDFMTYYIKKNMDFKNLIHLFGRDNLFIHGRFSAFTDMGKPFVTYYNQGVFRGLGLIESHRRSSSMVPIVYND